jgi:hypothetical protein
MLALHSLLLAATLSGLLPYLEASITAPSGGGWRPGRGIPSILAGLPKPTPEDLLQMDTKLQSHALFQRQGYLAGSVTWGHVLFEVDLRKPGHTLQTAREILDAVKRACCNETTIAASQKVRRQNERVSQAKARLDAADDRWDSYETVFKPSSLQQRKKRATLTRVRVNWGPDENGYIFRDGRRTPPFTSIQDIQETFHKAKQVFPDGAYTWDSPEGLNISLIAQRNDFWSDRRCDAYLRDLAHPALTPVCPNFIADAARCPTVEDPCPVAPTLPSPETRRTRAERRKWRAAQRAAAAAADQRRVSRQTVTNGSLEELDWTALPRNWTSLEEVNTIYPWGHLPQPWDPAYLEPGRFHELGALLLKHELEHCDLANKRLVDTGNLAPDWFDDLCPEVPWRDCPELRGPCPPERAEAYWLSGREDLPLRQRQEQDQERAGSTGQIPTRTRVSEETRFPRHSLWTQEEEEEARQLSKNRTERAFWMPAALGLVLGGGAVGGFSLLFSSTQLSAIYQELANGKEQHRRDHQFILGVLQNHSSHLDYADERLFSLEASRTQVMSTVSDLVAEANMDYYLTLLDGAVGYADSVVDQTTASLDGLLDRRLSPQFVGIEALEKQLALINQRANAAGFSSPVAQPGWLYQLPIAFQSEEEHFVTVYLHVPLYRADDLLSLFKVFTMPVALNASVHAVRVIPETTMLAINSKQTSFTLLEEQHLPECTKVGELFLCPHTNYVLTRPREYCLTSLFLRFEEEATKVCPTEVVPASVVVTQVSHEEFFVYHPRKQRLVVTCPTPSNSHVYEFRGALLIPLGPKCFGLSEGYQIAAHPEFTVNQTLITSSTEWTVRSLLHDISLPVLAAILPEPPRSAVPMSDVLSQYRSYIAQQDPLPMVGAVGFSLSMTIGIVVSVLMLIFCCRRRIARSARAFVQPDDNDDDDDAAPGESRRRGILRRGAIRRPDVSYPVEKRERDASPPPYGTGGTKDASSSLYPGLNSWAHQVGRLSPAPFFQRYLSPLTPTVGRVLNTLGSSPEARAVSRSSVELRAAGSYSAVPSWEARGIPGRNCCGPNSSWRQKLQEEVGAPKEEESSLTEAERINLDLEKIEAAPPPMTGHRRAMSTCLPSSFSSFRPLASVEEAGPQRHTVATSPVPASFQFVAA